MPRADKNIRIVMDVNLWISCLLTPSFRPRCRFLFQQPYELLLSDAFYREFDATVIKPKLQKRLSSDAAAVLREELQKYGTMVKVYTVVNVCRDLNDNYLLALSQDGNADYLITRDKDLLVLKQFGKTKIVTITEFAELQT